MYLDVTVQSHILINCFINIDYMYTVLYFSAFSLIYVNSSSLYNSRNIHCSSDNVELWVKSVIETFLLFQFITFIQSNSALGSKYSKTFIPLCNKDLHITKKIPDLNKVKCIYTGYAPYNELHRPIKKFWSLTFCHAEFYYICVVSKHYIAQNVVFKC